MRWRIQLVLAATFAAAAASAQSDLVKVVSPNRKIEFDLFLATQPDTSEPLLRLVYRVLFNGKELMGTSFMGLNVRDQPILGVNVGLVKTTVVSAG